MLHRVCVARRGRLRAQWRHLPQLREEQRDLCSPGGRRRRCHLAFVLLVIRCGLVLRRLQFRCVEGGWLAGHFGGRVLAALRGGLWRLPRVGRLLACGHRGLSWPEQLLVPRRLRVDDHGVCDHGPACVDRRAARAPASRLHLQPTALAAAATILDQAALRGALELSPRHRPAPTPPAPPARPHSPFSPPSPAHTPADRCPLACTARRSPPRP